MFGFKDGNIRFFGRQIQIPVKNRNVYRLGWGVARSLCLDERNTHRKFDMHREYISRVIQAMS